MPRKRLENRSTRKIFRSGKSNAITIPIEILRELKWRKGQKVVVKKLGKNRIVIEDWKK